MEGAGGQTGGWDERGEEEEEEEGGRGQKEKKNLEAPPWKSESCSCAAGRIATSSVLKAHKQKQPFPKACVCVFKCVCGSTGDRSEASDISQVGGGGPGGV